MNRRVRLPAPVAAIYRAVSEPEALDPRRKFTPDGRLVGAIGQVVAAEALGLTLHRGSYPGTTLSLRTEMFQFKMTAGLHVSLSMMRAIAWLSCRWCRPKRLTSNTTVPAGQLGPKVERWA